MFMNTRNILRKALMIVSISVLAVSPAMASGYSARINSSSARVYADKSTYGSVPNGTAVTVKETNDGWAKISISGKTFYVQTKYLDSVEARVTGYVASKATVYKSASSSSKKLGTLNVGAKVEVVGSSGSYAKITNGSNTGYVKSNCLSKSKPKAQETSSDWTDKVKMTDWYDGGSSILSRGSYGYIYDIDTGITVRIKRMGGIAHADVEPATTADTAKLKRIAGGSFSWDSHAVILHVGSKYVAAAINTMPHGEETLLNNNYEGQFCLHMLNSKTHASDTTNVNHQSSVKRAYRWAQNH